MKVQFSGAVGFDRDLRVEFESETTNEELLLEFLIEKGFLLYNEAQGSNIGAFVMIPTPLISKELESNEPKK